MNKIKKLKNKIKIVTLCLVTILSGLGSTGLNVKGATPSIVEGRKLPNTGATITQGFNSVWWADGISYIYADGEVAFCIEPMQLGIAGNIYTAGDFDTETKRTLSRIVYYGWDISAKTDNDYITTQFMIWEALGVTITWKGSFGAMYPALKANVQAKINAHEIVPSFHEGSYEVDLGDTLSVPDANGVLNQFHVISSAGANVSISGNNLVITPTIDTPDNITIQLQKELDSCVGSSIAYRSGTGQDVGKFKVSDPKFSRINIKVNKYGSVKIAKTDDEGLRIPNTKYKLSYNVDMSDPIGEYTTGADGTVQIDTLKPQLVYVQELSVPHNLVLNPTIQSIMIKPNEVVEYSQMNKIQKGKVTPKKVDADTNGKAQGDATLKGAVYGLFAKENIVNPITGNILIPAGTLVTERTTKADGTMDAMDNLYLGTYYLQEITPSEGYLLNNEKIEIILAYGGENVEVVTTDKTSKETVAVGNFDLEKIITSADASEIVQKEQGAEFIVVAKKYVTKYGTIEEAWKHKDEFTDKEFDKLVTDKNGYDKSKNLAYGTYVVKQTVGQIDTDKLEASWEFKVEKNNQETIRYIINNRPFKSYLKLVKVDKESGKTITVSNATFKIRNTDTNELLTQKVGDKHQTEWSTDEDGDVVLPLQLKVGNYQVEEIKSPLQYLLNEKPVPFKITSTLVSEKDDDGDPIKIVKFSDEAVKGKVIVEKKGNVLTSKITDRMGNVHFNYEERSIPGMEFNLVAEEDILDPADHEVLFKKGTVVRQGVTGANGQATINDLYLGKYRVVETKAPENFVISTDDQVVELKSTDDKTPIVTSKVIVRNKKQDVNVKVLKLDNDENVSLKGAVFGLYAKEDILNFDGNVLVKKDTLLETSDSNEDGIVEFNIDLPNGKYYAKELTPPIGYVSSDKAIEFDATYTDQLKEVIELTTEFKNSITKIEVAKVDATTGKGLANNHLKVYEKGDKGNIVDTWISTTETHLIKGLEVGKTYVLSETSSAYGFSIASDVEFTVLDTEEIQVVTMRNDLVVGQLNWNKTGDVFTRTDIGMTELGLVQSPVWENQNILGAEITIYAEEDIVLGNDVTYYMKDQKIQTLDSDLDSVLSEYFPVGKYYYVETKTPIGMVTNNERHSFEITDNQKAEIQIVNSTLNNERPIYKFDFTKTMDFSDTSANELAYKDVVFGVFTRDDTYDYKGNVAIEPDTLVATSGIDAEGHLTNSFNLPVGNYYFKELATNSAYNLNKKEFDFSIDQSNEKEVLIEINDGKPITNTLKEYYMLVNKVDSVTNKNIVSEQFKFASFSDKECTKKIVEKSADTKDGTVQFTLNYGITYIKETSAPNGYLLSPEVIVVEVNDDGLFVNGKRIGMNADLLYSIRFPNSLIPTVKTGVYMDTTFPMAMALSSLGVMILVIGLKKRKEGK